MLAEHVEAKGLHLQDIMDHGLVGRCRIQPVRIIALIKDAIVIIRPAV